MQFDAVKRISERTPLKELFCRKCEWSGSARGPDCPSQRGVAHGFGPIPVSAAGESVQVGGGVEQKGEMLGTPRSDMACG